MPTPSAAVLEALESNVTFMCQIVKVTARDGAVAAYSNHSRHLTIGGTTYQPGAWDVSRDTLKEGLEADSGEISGPYDSVITLADVSGGRWRGARLYKAYVVDYRDLSLGVVQERNGFVGKVFDKNGTFRMEQLGLTSRLHQTRGALISRTDRNRRPEDLGVNMTPFTHARTVVSFTDRQTFVISGVAQADNYFQYGRCEFTTGANAGLEMEIKSNTGNSITLALPMHSNIANGDAVILIAGYDGTREQARDKFGSMINFDGEPDAPTFGEVTYYPNA